MNDRNMKNKGTKNRGFASMSHKKVEEIAHKGGQARAEQAGHDGMAEMGRKGGKARAEQLGHEGYVELGRKGGQARAEQAGHEGMAEIGRKGGKASHSHEKSRLNGSEDNNFDYGNKSNKKRDYKDDPWSKK